MNEAIRFQRAREEGTHITLTAIGDIMMQGPTQSCAHAMMDASLSDPDEHAASGFARLFMLCDEVRVETGILHDGVAYGEAAYPRLVGRLGMPNFDAHPGLARTLKRVGFDLVSTANNHALDRGHNGIDRTVDALQTAGLDYVGTLRSDEVLKRPDVDFVIVAAHWGRDYVGWVLPGQRRLARQLIDAGADLILGHHPHVLQPMQTYQTCDGREALVLFSLGNFMSDMYGVRARSTAIVYISITKNETDTFISSLSYLPVARHVSIEPETGRSIIHPVATNRVDSGQLVRERAHIVGVLGPANLKRADDLVDFTE